MVYLKVMLIIRWHSLLIKYCSYIYSNKRIFVYLYLINNEGIPVYFYHSNYEGIYVYFYHILVIMKEFLFFFSLSFSNEPMAKRYYAGLREHIGRTLQYIRSDCLGRPMECDSTSVLAVWHADSWPVDHNQPPTILMREAVCFLMKCRQRQSIQVHMITYQAVSTHSYSYRTVCIPLYCRQVSHPVFLLHNRTCRSLLFRP